MSVQAAAIVLAWVAIVMLAAALAACVRALRFHEARLAQLGTQPRRLEPGDRIRLPDQLSADLAGGDVLLVFGKSECRSCVEAVRRLGALASAAPGRVPVVALWRGPAPAQGVPAGGVVSHHEHQARAFEELMVGLLPTAVLARRGRVVASGAVGSPEAVDELWTAVLGQAPDGSPREQHHGPAGDGAVASSEREGKR